MGMTSQQTPSYDYLRVRIRCKLRTESLLHCGNGEEIPVAGSDWAEVKGEKGHINTLCRNGDKPYIPASTLRGSLRERCLHPGDLFGEAHGDEGKAGAVRVYDARWLTQAEPPEEDRYYQDRTHASLRDGVSIDPITGTAAENRLFCFEVVPAGASFEVLLEADRISQARLSELLGLLETWDGTAATALGKGRSKGWGRVRLQGKPQVEVLTDQDLIRWAKGPADTPLPLKPMVQLPDDQPPKTGKSIRFRFCLHPHSPLLVNDPAQVRPKKNKDDDPAQVRPKTNEDDHFPDLEFLRDAAGAALLPGASLRGALRARGRRILATIAHQDFGVSPEDVCDLVADPLIRRLFGTEGRRSALWVGDARAARTKPHEQHFNAVDRFTGRVADGALYSARAADCDRLEGDATLDLPRLPLEEDWWKGLLLMIARDLMAGDIPMGWGKSRGYGECQATGLLPTGEEIQDFQALLEHLRGALGEDAPGQWARALHRMVKETLAKGRAGASS